MWRRFASSISASSSRHTRTLCVSRTSRLSNPLLWKPPPAIVDEEVFDTEAFVRITSPITKGEETWISRPALSRCLHNVALTTPPWRLPQGHHRRAASRFSKIVDSPRQTNSLLQCNSGQMMETARRQIARAMKFVVFFGNLSVGNTRARGAPHSLLCSGESGRLAMALYRVWRSDPHDCYWTMGSSEADAIETVSTTLGIDATEWKAARDSDTKYNIPAGAILDRAGKPIAIKRG